MEGGKIHFILIQFSRLITGPYFQTIRFERNGEQAARRSGRKLVTSAKRGKETIRRKEGRRVGAVDPTKEKAIQKEFFILPEIRNVRENSSIWTGWCTTKTRRSTDLAEKAG